MIMQQAMAHPFLQPMQQRQMSAPQFLQAPQVAAPPVAAPPQAPQGAGAAGAGGGGGMEGIMNLIKSMMGGGGPGLGASAGTAAEGGMQMADIASLFV